MLSSLKQRFPSELDLLHFPLDGAWNCRISHVGVGNAWNPVDVHKEIPCSTGAWLEGGAQSSEDGTRKPETGRLERLEIGRGFVLLVSIGGEGTLAVDFSAHATDTILISTIS